MSALAGKRIVVTRAPHQAGDLETLLREKDALPLLYPCIDIQPPDDPSPLYTALRAAADGAFDWLVVTSANTTLALRRGLDELGIDPMRLTGLKVAAVGDSTARAVAEQLGLQASLIPEQYNAASLAEALHLPPSTSVFLPQSAIAEPTLAMVLSNLGAQLTVVRAYQTVIGSGGVDLPTLLKAGEVHAITFTSASTVHNLLSRLLPEGGSINLLRSVCIACIGTITAEAARKAGLSVAVIPDVQTLARLVAGLDLYFAKLAVGES